MSPIREFEDMEVWKVARLLTHRVYRLTAEGMWSRDYGLRDQIRRSAVSIMSNIAEGFESDGAAQFQRFLGYAKGSAGEVRAQLYVALAAGYVSQETFDELSGAARSCSRQLHGFIAYLQSRTEGHRLADALADYDMNRPETSEPDQVD